MVTCTHFNPTIIHRGKQTIAESNTVPADGETFLALLIQRMPCVHQYLGLHLSEIIVIFFKRSKLISLQNHLLIFEVATIYFLAGS